jgi:hypothetical protein
MASHAPLPAVRADDRRNGLEHSRRVFLLARAQLAAGRVDLSRREVAMRRWSPHHRRFS